MISENGTDLVAAPAPDARWTEAEGFPYAGNAVSTATFNSVESDGPRCDASARPLLHVPAMADDE
ncbi:hypothetical protein ELI30_32975 (plasmid) [Rhizobium leguminosarum]|nr:hypothetical protein ELI40_29765 [Rhizobium leguminosarum]TAV41884.1 hypothetical protein ELI31_31850 [Rhizobium leguminosarum]TAV42352.1 hypothetical protein ELI32_33165 [Rhizobium leguminosarum]TAV61601.1 hypothetical protein ELI30_32975 [Rhizobium leguminosarum]TAX01810.1 hypothetical protein ELI07_34360 [Rhizobium leguminosarum]